MNDILKLNRQDNRRNHMTDMLITLTKIHPVECRQTIPYTVCNYTEEESDISTEYYVEGAIKTMEGWMMVNNLLSAYRQP